MTEKDGRIVIAEFCGIPKHARFWAQDHGGMRWSNFNSLESAQFFNFKTDTIEELWIINWLPDYYNSLDAIHKAVAILDKGMPFDVDTPERIAFRNNLMTILGIEHFDTARLLKATAAQHAEALVLTIKQIHEQKN